MTYKLIALDLDGTLLNDSMCLAPRVAQSLARAQAQGTHVTLASGRSYAAMRPWVERLAIETPVIGYQGATITSAPTGRHIYHRAFSRDMIPDLQSFARQHGLSLTLYADDLIYVEDKRESDAFYEQWFGLPWRVVDDLAAAISIDPTKFIIVGQPEELDAVTPAVVRTFAERLSITRSHRFFLEGQSLDSSKGIALAWLADLLGVAQAETMAIGDSGNDRSMLTYAGLGVAMGNASSDVKAIANWVAPSVDDDGVAVALEQFVL